MTRRRCGSSRLRHCERTGRPRHPGAVASERTRGAAHCSPGGADERRYCTNVARATALPSCIRSHSALCTRLPSRTTRTSTVVSTRRAALNRSTVRRVGMKSVEPQWFSRVRAANPTTAGPFRWSSPQWLFAKRVGMNAAVLGYREMRHFRCHLRILAHRASVLAIRTRQGRLALTAHTACRPVPCGTDDDVDKACRPAALGEGLGLLVESSRGWQPPARRPGSGARAPGTARPVGGTRRTSRRPVSMSDQWCTVASDQATVAVPSGSGRSSAVPAR